MPTKSRWEQRGGMRRVAGAASRVAGTTAPLRATACASGAGRRPRVAGLSLGWLFQGSPAAAFAPGQVRVSV
jgi:hypothetical protein